MMLTDLAGVLRSAGLPVVEVGGWQSRSNDGNRFAGVWGILCHWTATALTARGDYPSLNIVTNGRSDLPGMLAQLGLGRDGTWYVIGAGVAWHAGTVDRTASDNYHAIGIEAEYHPDQGAWPDAQQRSYERGCAALAAHYGVPLDQVRGHYEAAVPYGRKPDPNTLPGGMPGFRQRVAAVNLQEGFDVSAKDVWTWQGLSYYDPATEQLVEGAFTDPAELLKKSALYTEKSWWYAIDNRNMLLQLAGKPQLTAAEVAAEIRPGLVTDLMGVLGAIVKQAIEENGDVELSPDASSALAADIIGRMGGLLSKKEA